MTHHGEPPHPHLQRVMREHDAVGGADQLATKPPARNEWAILLAASFVFLLTFLVTSLIVWAIVSIWKAIL